MDPVTSLQLPVHLRIGTYVAASTSVSRLEAKDVMTENLETLRLGDTLDLAAAVLTLSHVRHLPVTDPEGRLQGLVTHRDLLRAWGDIYQMKGTDDDAAYIQVDHVMTRNVLSVSPNAPALEAARIIFEEKVGCVPVVDNDRLVGIITEADFVRMAIQELSDAGR